MSATFRKYVNNTQYGEDYNNVRNFLINLDNQEYHFGRWDWMVMNRTNYYADPQGFEKIGLWEDNGKIVSLVIYDTNLGHSFLLALNEYNYLKEEMFIYAKENFKKNDEFEISVPDGDLYLQSIVSKYGFFPTQDKDCDLIFPIDLEKIDYTLPKGYKIISLKDNFDIYKYGQVLWKGFNHEVKAEGPYYLQWEKYSKNYLQQWKRPNIDLSLKIFVEAPDGNFVSHCGMWFEPNLRTALVEPVATEPAYRKMGLGKAVVLEGIKRCGLLGAERAFVGSTQQFYYNIGFRPFASSTWWKEKERKIE